MHAAHIGNLQKNSGHAVCEKIPVSWLALSRHKVT